MYNNQNGGRRNNYPPRNVCQNFWLRCNSMRTNNNGTVTLNCMLYAKKRQDGSYPATMFIGVYCDFQQGCQMPEVDYTNKLISVSGRFAADSYFNPKANCELPQYTIYADSVQIVDFENNNGYQQNNGYQNRNENNYRQNRNGYQQNNNYQNGSYRQNGGYPQQNYQNNGFPQNQPMNQQPPQNYQQNYQNNGFPQNQNMNQPLPQAPVPQNMQTSPPQSAPPTPPQQENPSLADFEVIIDENGNVPF